MGTLLVVSGPPGAGKSTVAALLAARFDPSVLVEGDAFFAFLARGAIEPWLPESHAQNDVVVRAAAAAAGAYARGGYTTVYDGVVGPWFFPGFAAATGLDRVEYVVLMPTVEECWRRVDTRADHGFRDEAATRKMHQEFSAAVVEARHVLVEPPADPYAVVDEVLQRLERGALAYAVGS